MIGTTQFTCCVCGISLPGTRQELIARGAATIQGNGQILFHCNAGRHTHEEIQKAIHATPTFSTAKNMMENQKKPL